MPLAEEMLRMTPLDLEQTGHISLSANTELHLTVSWKCLVTTDSCCQISINHRADPRSA